VARAAAQENEIDCDDPVEPGALVVVASVLLWKPLIVGGLKVGHSRQRRGRTFGYEGLFRE
jgi:hypothetical protein